MAPPLPWRLCARAVLVSVRSSSTGTAGWCRCRLCLQRRSRAGDRATGAPALADTGRGSSPAGAGGVRRDGGAPAPGERGGGRRAAARGAASRASGDVPLPNQRAQGVPQEARARGRHQGGLHPVSAPIPPNGNAGTTGRGALRGTRHSSAPLRLPEAGWREESSACVIHRSDLGPHRCLIGGGHLPNRRLRGELSPHSHTVKVWHTPLAHARHSTPAAPLRRCDDDGRQFSRKRWGGVSAGRGVREAGRCRQATW